MLSGGFSATGTGHLFQSGPAWAKAHVLNSGPNSGPKTAFLERLEKWELTDNPDRA